MILAGKIFMKTFKGALCNPAWHQNIPKQDQLIRARCFHNCHERASKVDLRYANFINMAKLSTLNVWWANPSAHALTHTPQSPISSALLVFFIFYLFLFKFMSPISILSPEIRLFHSIFRRQAASRSRAEANGLKPQSNCTDIMQDWTVQLYRAALRCTEHWSHSVMKTTTDGMQLINKLWNNNMAQRSDLHLYWYLKTVWDCIFARRSM